MNALVCLCRSTHGWTERMSCVSFQWGRVGLCWLFLSMVFVSNMNIKTLWSLSVCESIETLAKVSIKFGATNQKRGVKFSGSVGRHYKGLGKINAICMATRLHLVTANQTLPGGNLWPIRNQWRCPGDRERGSRWGGRGRRRDGLVFDYEESKFSFKVCREGKGELEPRITVYPSR